MHGNVKGWLEERHWKAKELQPHLSARKNIEFRIHMMSDAEQGRVVGHARFNPGYLHCSFESIETPGARLEVREGHLRVVDRTQTNEGDKSVIDERISFSYEGSILSQLKREVLPQSLIEFKDYFLGVRSLDLLTPDFLRQRTRQSDGTLGLGGQKLSAFVHEIGPERRAVLTEKLREVYPQLETLDSKPLRSGWKQLEIRESFGGRTVVTEARHINDGMLRLMAILAELQSDIRFLLFDEIENGINPELVEFVVDLLVNASQQVLVTTHSPMILNYLDDETAKEGVVYLYKTPQGHTRSIPFFSIPSLNMKLRVMGPGEAFVDTNLTKLAEEIADIPKEEA